MLHAVLEWSPELGHVMVLLASPLGFSGREGYVTKRHVSQVGKWDKNKKVFELFLSLLLVWVAAYITSDSFIKRKLEHNYSAHLN